jgi:hypothetical protein
MARRPKKKVEFPVGGVAGPSAKRLGQFKQAILKGADTAREEGIITARQRRAVTRCCRHPVRLFFLRKWVTDAGVAMGAISPKAATNPNEIDWDALLEFIKELMPLILEFIEMLMLLFGGI